MSAGVETMFDTRTKPWHGLGENVKAAPDSGAALKLAGMDWQVIQKALVTHDGIPVPGFKANLRDTDHQVLGVVTDRYRVVQNREAFAFTDALLGEGVVLVSNIVSTPADIVTSFDWLVDCYQGDNILVKNGSFTKAFYLTANIALIENGIPLCTFV